MNECLEISESKMIFNLHFEMAVEERRYFTLILKKVDLT